MGLWCVSIYHIVINLPLCNQFFFIADPFTNFVFFFLGDRYQHCQLLCLFFPNCCLFLLSFGAFTTFICAFYLTVFLFSLLLSLSLFLSCSISVTLSLFSVPPLSLIFLTPHSFCSFLSFFLSLAVSLFLPLSLPLSVSHSLFESLLHI